MLKITGESLPKGTQSVILINYVYVLNSCGLYNNYLITYCPDPMVHDTIIY